MRKTKILYMLMFTLTGCNQGGEDSASPSPVPPPSPPPVSITRPIASNVTIANDNGQLTGSYQYTNEDGVTEGKSLIYWKNSNTIVGTGKQYTIKTTDLNQPVYFCVKPVTNDGLEGEITCSDQNTTSSVALAISLETKTTTPHQIVVYENISIIPDAPESYGLTTLDVKNSTSQYIGSVRDSYDGYNTNDITTKIWVDGTFSLENYTPRAIIAPVVRIKSKGDNKNHYYKLNNTLQPFSYFDIAPNERPFKNEDIAESQFIDPNPLYVNMIDHFVSPEDSDDLNPDDEKWEPITDVNDISGYNKNLDYNKQYYNRLSTLLHYIDYFTDARGVVDKSYSCEAKRYNDNYYVGCNNPDFFTHAWGRLIKDEVNAKYYYLKKGIEDAGLATQGGSGLLMLGLQPDYISGVGATFEHEHAHNLGYGHDSGITGGWSNEFYAWIQTLGYYDVISTPEGNSQVVHENSDYTYHTEWIDNTTAKVTFLAKSDDAMPLTKLAIIAQDEQDPDYTGGETTYSGITGHQKNYFTVQTVYQVSPSTIYIKLNAPMRYAGNSLAIMAEPDYTQSSTGYVSLTVNNSNDIEINDTEAGVVIVDALDPDYRQKAYFNGSTGHVGLGHDFDYADNQGVDDATGGANLYNIALEHYQSWDVGQAADYCINRGKKGLAKINTDNDALYNLQEKYLHNAAIIALDSKDNPTIFKPGDDPLRGQLIACSAN